MVAPMLGQLLNYGIENIPPATLALIAAQAAIFLDFFPDYFPSAIGVCVSSYMVYYHKDWPRMFWSTFYHATDMHLYFNMLSLLYKGSYLERKYGTPYFMYLVAVFSALTSATYVGLGFLFSRFLDEPSYMTTCAVGFSGVLFGLKVLTTEDTPPGIQYAFGVIPVPNKYMFWAELILIQLLVPNASFVGHLSGILVGLAFTRGPLKFIMDIFFPPGLRRREPGSSTYHEEIPPVRNSAHDHSPTYQSRANSTALRSNAPAFQDGYNYGYRSRSQNYDRYTGGFNEDEQYQQAVEESMRESRQSSFNTKQPATATSNYPSSVQEFHC